MKVGDARKTYSYQLRQYNSKLYELHGKQNALTEAAKKEPEKKDEYQAQLDAITVDYEAVKKKQEEYRAYMDQVMAQWETSVNSEIAKQDAESAKQQGEEMGKLMTVARRLMHGDTVPPQDEKKLMEFDKDLYQMAKHMQTMAMLEKKKHKSYESLWDEEPEKPGDPLQMADEEELAAGPGPEVVSVDATIEAAHAEE